MSAYDNPTIIKDDSAMAWATGFAGIGQAFTESYNIARKEREAKEKEAKLDAEKRAKESEQLLLNIQRTNAEIQNQNAADASKTFSEVPKTLDTTLSTTFNNDVVEFGKIFGEADVKNQTVVVGADVKDVLAKKPIYLKARQNVIAGFVAWTDQANSYDEAIQKDGSDVAIVGKTPVERLTNFFTLKGSNPKNVMSSTVTKDLKWNKENPSEAIASVSKKFDNEQQLIDSLKIFAPFAAPEEYKKMIEESIGKGITKNADNSYTLDFKQDLGSGTWDGVFYVKVPPVTTGDELKNSYKMALDQYKARQEAAKTGYSQEELANAKNDINKTQTGQLIAGREAGGGQMSKYMGAVLSANKGDSLLSLAASDAAMNDSKLLVFKSTLSGANKLLYCIATNLTLVPLFSFTTLVK